MSKGPLSKHDMDRIFAKALWFLENKGMIVEHEEILNFVLIKVPAAVEESMLRAS